MLVGACLSISFAILMMREKSLAAVIAKLCTFDTLALVVASAVCSHIIVTQSVPLIAAIASSQQIILDRRTDGLIISGNWACAQALVMQSAELTPLCNPPALITKSKESVEAVRIKGFGVPWAFFWTSIEPLPN
jgi:hypothetical protein